MCRGTTRYWRPIAFGIPPARLLNTGEIQAGVLSSERNAAPRTRPQLQDLKRGAWPRDVADHRRDPVAARSGLFLQRIHDVKKRMAEAKCMSCVSYHNCPIGSSPEYGHSQSRIWSCQADQRSQAGAAPRQLNASASPLSNTQAELGALFPRQAE